MGGDPGRQRRRAVQRAADRPLHRRLHDRRLARDRRRRPLPAGVRLPRAARRRRVGDLGQPGREPVADDHRPGRAGDGVLAQQGRARPPPGARRGVPAARPRSRPRPRWSRRRLRRRSAADRRASAKDLPTIGQTRKTAPRHGVTQPALSVVSPARPGMFMLPPEVFGFMSRWQTTSVRVAWTTGPGHPPSPAGPWWSFRPPAERASRPGASTARIRAHRRCRGVRPR